MNHFKQGTVGRGMSLEDDINKSNEYYLSIDRAVIYKKPTPVQIVKVDYPSRSHAKIIEAYYKVPSTTDYNGVYRGCAIDFEAKETKNKTLFPFKWIHPHQIKHLERVIHHGGIGFIILRFSSLQETFLIDAKIIVSFYQDPNKKSITYKEATTLGYKIKAGLTPRLEYLNIIDEIYFK